MKKLLIATSAVIGLGLVSADFAAAQVETSFSGLVRVRITKGAKTTEADASPLNYAQRATLGVERAQLQWDASATSDSGLSYGARIRLRPTADAGGRHLTYVYFGGGFGQVTLGNQFGATSSAYAGVGNASTGSYGLDGQYSCSTGTTPKVGSVARLPCPVADAAWDTFEGIGYKSPSLSGATIYVDYSGGNGNKDDGNGNGHVTAAVHYATDIGDGSMNAVLSYYRGRSEDTVDTAGVVTTAAADPKKVVMLAADASFGPVTVGANYFRRGSSGASKTQVINALEGGQTAWLLAAKYNFGPGAVSLGYGRGSAKAYSTAKAAGTTTHKDNTTTVVLSAGYTVAPGWTVYGDVYRHTSKTGKVAADTSASSTQWVLGTNVSF